MEKGEEESVAKTMTIKVEQNQEENEYLFIYGNFMPYGEKNLSSLISSDPSIQSNRLIYIIYHFDLTEALHYWLKRDTWIKKRCKKLAKVDLCFSFNKLTR